MRKFAVLSFIIIFLFSYGTLVYGGAIIPKRINIGLNYGSPMFHNINIKSKKPVEIVLKKNEKDETIAFKLPIDFSFRKDLYYNILNDEVKNIQFIKAVKYSGVLLGPYHVQIGNTYNDYNSAKEALTTIEKSIKGSYIAYENGWKIWYQLLLDQKECKEQIDILEKQLPNVKYTIIEPNDNRIQIIDATTGNTILICNCNEILITPKESDNESNLIEYNGSNYRGNIIIKVLEDGSIGVINNIPFDYYLYGVVPCEMYPLWHMEALKAQAVAARNYAMLNINKHKKDGYDLCNTQHCQVYKGYDKEHQNTNNAVDQTKGKLLFYKNELAQTYYHSSSGGHTDNSENVWSEAIPYIRGVDDSFSLGSPNDVWISELDKSFIENKLVESKIDIGNLVDINAIDISEFGRVKKLEITGTKDSTILEKEKIRFVLGTSNIKSIWYEIETESDINIFNMHENNNIIKRPNGLNLISANGKIKLLPKEQSIFVKGLFDVKKYDVLPKKYVFSGKGWGHGLGMSQYGAKGMAESGFDYIKILQYYYKGTKVQ